MNINQLFSTYLHATGSAKVYRPVSELPVNALRRLGLWYENALHTPGSVPVLLAYRALAQDVYAQYAALLGAGFKISRWMDAGQPYAGSREMIADAYAGQLKFFPTEAGFGDSPDENLMLAPSPFYCDGHRMLLNDVFRVVHDLFGHAAHGLSFSALGELNAFRAHPLLFTPDSLPALAAETAAQNAWVNFGPHKPDTLPAPDRPYAKQKNCYVPGGMLADLHFIAPSPVILGGVGTPA